MGHQDADAENNENTRHSRNHIYFPVPADLKGRSGCTVKANPEQTVCFLSLMSLGHTARRIQHRQTDESAQPMLPTPILFSQTSQPTSLSLPSKYRAWGGGCPRPRLAQAPRPFERDEFLYLNG
jgi:hypothetical protein